MGSRQKVCGRAECQASRKKQSQRKWSEKHRDYWEIHQLKGECRKIFRAKKAAYMREYRRRHPEYVKRDNARRNQARRVEKPSLEEVRRNQDERFVKVKELKRVIVELLPCRNQDVRCVQPIEEKGLARQLPAP